MGRRKTEEFNVRKLAKTGRGSSFAITLPISYVRQLGWRERQKLIVTLRGKKITVEDWPAR